jgi:IMP dehydrogenase/GMP reductase
MKIYSKKDLNSYSQSLTYDDISLIPLEISRVKSRIECDTKCSFLGEEFLLPVMSSPMDSVTGLRMAEELTDLGCLGIVNRFDSSLDEVIKSGDETKVKAVSISLHAK